MFALFGQSTFWVEGKLFFVMNDKMIKLNTVLFTFAINKTINRMQINVSMIGNNWRLTKLKKRKQTNEKKSEGKTLPNVLQSNTHIWYIYISGNWSYSLWWIGKRINVLFWVCLGRGARGRSVETLSDCWQLPHPPVPGCLRCWFSEMRRKFSRKILSRCSKRTPWYALHLRHQLE